MADPALTPPPRTSPLRTSRILVTHPGRQHSHQAALALEAAGLLAGYWAGAPSLDRHRRGIPDALWRRFVRYAPVALPPARVRWCPWPPLLRRLGDRLLPPRLAYRVDFAACRLFDHWAASRLSELSAARRLGGVPATAVIACEISALSTFRRARALGLGTFLDAPSIHHRAQDRLHGFAEPAALHRRIVAVKDAELALADAVLTVSELARETYLEAGLPPEKVLAIPLGADLELFAAGGDEPRTGPCRFVFAGAMIRRKGFDLLLAAFDAVRRAVPGVELTIAGPPGDAASALAGYDPRGLDLAGTLSQAELARRFRQADALVLPSRNDSYGMVVAEALACGLPAIVSTMVGSRELVRDGETGWVVPVDDLPALTARLLAGAERPETLRAMRAACRKAAEPATWAAYAERFAAVIRAIDKPGTAS